MKTLLFFVFINIFWVQCVLRTKVTEDILDSSIYQAKEQSFGEDNEPLLLTPLINEGNLFEARRLSKVAPNILDTLDILDSSIYQAKEQSFGEDNEPLLLTPLINEGNLFEARRLSKVAPNILDTVSYAGYFTVNKTCENHLFFWFFLAEESWEEQPVVLWLQGGPGGPSLYGLFEENGPFILVNGEPQSRPYSWNKRNNVIYIDQPVNTGYSFSGKKCYTASSRQCGIEVYSALVQFFTMFQELQDNRFYIAGESYAGHFVPHVGKAIHESNPTAKTKINLCGMMVWDPFINYIQNVNISDYLLNLGLVNRMEKQDIDTRLEKYVNAMKVEPIRPPNEDEDPYFILLPVLNNISVYDYTAMEETFDLSILLSYVTQPYVRKCLHVGNVTFSLDQDYKVYDAMTLDYYTSMVSVYEELLEHYLIVAPVGQLDIICGYPMVKKILESFTWSRADQYRTARRQRWCVDGFLAGYFTCAGNLCDVLIRDASHMAPKSQPKWSYVLMDSVTSSPVDDPMKAMTVCA